MCALTQRWGMVVVVTRREGRSAKAKSTSPLTRVVCGIGRIRRVERIYGVGVVVG